jgi:hypothetical protein
VSTILYIWRCYSAVVDRFTTDGAPMKEASRRRITVVSSLTGISKIGWEVDWW